MYKRQEQGFAGVQINKTPMLESFSDLLTLLDEVIAKLQQGQFPYQSLVFDSATALERLIHAAVLRSDPTFANNNKKAQMCIRDRINLLKLLESRRNAFVGRW